MIQILVIWKRFVEIQFHPYSKERGFVALSLLTQDHCMSCTNDGYEKKKASEGKDNQLLGRERHQSTRGHSLKPIKESDKDEDLQWTIECVK